jgi:transcriptional regulator with XRE-family HTH domain
MARVERDFVRFPVLLWVSENVSEFREERGWTQTQLANLAGVGLPYVNAIENRRGAPSLEILTNIARAFEVTVADLVEDPELRRKRGGLLR